MSEISEVPHLTEDPDEATSSGTYPNSSDPPDDQSQASQEPTEMAIRQPFKSGNSESMATVECRLEGADLWKKFHELGTEMIITKSGRY